MTVREWMEAAFAAGIAQRTWHRWLRKLPERGLVDVSISKRVTLTELGRRALEDEVEPATP